MATAKRLLNKENDATARRIRRLLTGTLAKEYVAGIRHEWLSIANDLIASRVPEDTGALKNSFIADGLSKAKNKFSFTTGFPDVKYASYQENKAPPPAPKTGKDWYQNHPKSHVFNGISKPEAGPHFLADMLNEFEESLREIAQSLKEQAVNTIRTGMKQGRKKK